MTCHQVDGKGIPYVYPPLAASDYLLENIDRALSILKYGQEDEIRVNGERYYGAMPAPGLDDQAVADVANYILNTWGNEYAPTIKREQVNAIGAP